MKEIKDMRELKEGDLIFEAPNLIWQVLSNDIVQHIHMKVIKSNVDFSVPGYEGYITFGHIGKPGKVMKCDHDYKLISKEEADELIKKEKETDEKRENESYAEDYFEMEEAHMKEIEKRYGTEYIGQQGKVADPTSYSSTIRTEEGKCIFFTTEMTKLKNGKLKFKHIES